MQSNVHAKNNIFCAWHGQFCSKSNSSKYCHQSHGGETKSRDSNKNPSKQKNQRKRKKSQNQSQNHLCRNCIQLWRKWNPSGNPIIKTLGERIKVSDFEEDSESDEKTDSHEDYIDEEEEEVKKDTNLCHQPSYNAEEMQIYLMTDEEKKKELEFQNLERGGKKEEKKRKGEHEIVQLKKKIVYHYYTQFFLTNQNF
ncbi:hypothetical protein M0813_15164 [Anaeramoeba flamelloides]|uniref:C3H1-type domain-containing protein n=1 Tax=Anaeramoeba flamelloides TaxID=1746091 RepID=A0ABQ8Z3N3_9EUKA|nr:hypothetical protein M0813_15164 [Anaeramoeba flamelloides]